MSKHSILLLKKSQKLVRHVRCKLEFSGEEWLNCLNWSYLCIWDCYTHLKLRAVSSLICPFPNSSRIHLAPCVCCLRPPDKSSSCSTGYWWAQEILLFILFLYLQSWGEVLFLPLCWELLMKERSKKSWNAFLGLSQHIALFNSVSLLGSQSP